jgi:adenylate cyclase
MTRVDGFGPANSVTIGAWRYDRRPGQLFRKDDAGRWAPASLGSRASDVLAVLVRHPGALVTKDELMDAVWPGVTVEANNLTVQIAALRRVLDDGVAGPSCIQTVAGRGYRLLCQDDGAGGPNLAVEPAAEVDPPTVASMARVPSWVQRHRIAIGGAILAIVLLAVTSYYVWPSRSSTPSRMSALVMPFENLGGPDDAKIAAALTDDLMSALSLTTPLRVVNGKASQALDDDRAPIGAIGRKLGARYVITGSERRFDGVLRVNARIISTETAAVLWTDRFDVSISDPASGQEQAVAHLRAGILKALTPLEVTRSQSERPDKPDGFDLHLRALALSMTPPTPSRSTEIRALHERALQLEPSSAKYRLWLVDAMLNEEDQNPHGRKDVYERTASLLAEAQGSEPGLWFGAFEKLYWVYWQENRRCPEVVDLAEQFIKRYPNVEGSGAAYRWLSLCQIVLGHADTAVAVMDHALTLEPGPYQSRHYRNLQFALLLLGRYDESIQAGERALASNPNDVSYERARLNRRLAAAYALTGRLAHARRKLTEAARIDPFFTLRGNYVYENASPVYAAQFARHNEGLRLAGARDHAEEDAVFDVAADQRLHQEFSGQAPLMLPGAGTIRTGALVRLLAERYPIVIDALTNFAGPSLPGAVGLRYVGAGGELTDLAQDRLRTTMRDLTRGDLDTPIVAVGWNSESFDGRNLALRLVTLGYTHVLWYRGGREAWEVRGLPEADLMPRDW